MEELETKLNEIFEALKDFKESRNHTNLIYLIVKLRAFRTYLDKFDK